MVSFASFASGVGSRKRRGQKALGAESAGAESVGGRKRGGKKRRGQKTRGRKTSVAEHAGAENVRGRKRGAENDQTLKVVGGRSFREERKKEKAKKKIPAISLMRRLFGLRVSFVSSFFVFGVRFTRARGNFVFSIFGVRFAYAVVSCRPFVAF